MNGGAEPTANGHAGPARLGLECAPSRRLIAPRLVEKPMRFGLVYDFRNPAQWRKPRPEGYAAPTTVSVLPTH